MEEDGSGEEVDEADASAISSSRSSWVEGVTTVDVDCLEAGVALAAAAEVLACVSTDARGAASAAVEVFDVGAEEERDAFLDEG